MRGMLVHLNLVLQFGSDTSVQGVKYAEAAHIKPLGKPHNGNDQPGNIICSYPNHHVMLDKGIFAIENDLTLKGLEGILTIHQDHELDKESLEYHKEHIFINHEKLIKK
jgi:putative restriction endonuclease